MLPLPVGKTERPSYNDRRGFQGHVKPSGGSQSDDDHDPVRTHQMREPGEGLGGIDVVKGRHGHDRIEGLWGKPDAENITKHPLDPRARMPRARPVEDRLIGVETDDVGNARVSKLL